MDFLKGSFGKDNSLKYSSSSMAWAHTGHTATKFHLRHHDRGRFLIQQNFCKAGFGGGGLLQLQKQILSSLFRKIPEWNDVFLPFLPLKPSWDPALWFGATWKSPRANNLLVPEGQSFHFDKKSLIAPSQYLIPIGWNSIGLNTLQKKSFFYPEGCQNTAQNEPSQAQLLQQELSCSKVCNHNTQGAEMGI